MKFLLSIFLIFSLFSFSARAEHKHKLKGDLSLETRAFQPDNNQVTRDFALALAARLNYRYTFNHFDAALRVFGRFDPVDPERRIGMVEEAWIAYKRGRWHLRLGAQMINWTATEAFHPADIINSRNLDSNIENAEKMGEPMLSVSFRLGNGSITGYYMPFLVDPRFPSPRSRLNLAGPGLEIGNALWLQGNGQFSDDNFAHQGGIRMSQSFGSADLSLHAIYHLDRSQPEFIFDPLKSKIRPVYLPVLQIGATYSQALGAFLLKAEGAYRNFDNPSSPTRLGVIRKKDHIQLALGTEYSIPYKNGQESTLLIDAQNIFLADKNIRRQLSLFQRDLSLGFRHAWNDLLGKELLFLFVVDLEYDHEYLWSFNYSQRINDTWGFKTGFRIIYAPLDHAIPSGLESLHKANQIYFTLTKHF